jgi:two-component system cell cycle response regulator
VNVLVADDDPVTRRILDAELTRLGHVPILCSDGEAALAALTSDHPPQLAILDWMMPNLDGLAVCRAIRAGTRPYVYIILVSARDTRADLLEALAAEADDFIAKPLDLVELRLRLRAGERVLAVQERLLETQRALQHLATHDALTTLLNRGAIVRLLEQELSRARRTGSPLGVMLADLDHFKVINDRYGHQAGDAVLREASRRMRDVLRTFDTMGRYGGEEFLIIAPGSDLIGVRMAAERVRRAMAAAPIEAGDQQIVGTVSIGIASTSAGLDDSSALIGAADVALYRAKNAGRNTVASEPPVPFDESAVGVEQDVAAVTRG